LKDRERDETLKRFCSAGPSALLACRALDEGLDVPTVDGAILERRAF
jgi:superfamily II DNA or RNA helicase